MTTKIHTYTHSHIHYMNQFSISKSSLSILKRFERKYSKALSSASLKIQDIKDIIATVAKKYVSFKIGRISQSLKLKETKRGAAPPLPARVLTQEPLHCE